MTISLSPQRRYREKAPAWRVAQWFNSDPLTLDDLRGRVVLVEAFQMLCPGCVRYGLPQADHISRVFGDDLAVIGLHTVFEHHDAMTPTSLAAFLAQYRVRFPVGVDAHEPPDPEPVTFGTYAMQGTPTTLLIDRDGILRGQQMGAIDDMVLAAAVARLIDERPAG
ncbi:redoxin domain-containing protein [Pseudonocardia endophytica]|uniref:Peroxiredoxin n=1 Tax=Pseudonocardia endophytica TaxID=401976 RepID=A0A4R1I2S4_PSEEN|nr:redoxin domain-containing protein [Pseudonocardia endophytica]TCK26809.1 peroxiredoxin [Pseudonocardia endophytica]